MSLYYSICLYVSRIAVALILVIFSVGAPRPVLAATANCTIPGPWSRIGVTSARGGSTLSPLQIAVDPTVIREGSRYRMWFTNANSLNQTGIATAESTDGMVWDVYRKPISPDPIMDLVLTAPAGAWDSPGIETANVIRGPDGIYRLYYAGNHVPQGSSTYAIGLATSPDGIQWTRRDQPVLEASNIWEQPVCTTRGDPTTCSMGGVLEPSVIYDPLARQYKLWYVGLGEPANSFRTFRIGYAVSSDGVSWTRRLDPVFTLGPPDAWDEVWTTHVHVVADPGAGYHMFYFGTATKDYQDGVEMQRGSIGHAYSANGINWQRDPANPILSPRAGQVDAWSVGGPTALFEGSQIKLWYFGSPTSGLKSSVVLAAAPCGP